MFDFTTHTLAINDLLTRFFQAFDDKNWSMMRDCLCDGVYADYSSFRGVPAATISADRYVEQRRTALEALDTQHAFVNLRVKLDAAGGTASARCDYFIHRYHPSFDGHKDYYFHSDGHYAFAFVNIDGPWRISRITQNVRRNYGNPEIHGATRTGS